MNNVFYISCFTLKGIRKTSGKKPIQIYRRLKRPPLNNWINLFARSHCHFSRPVNTRPNSGKPRVVVNRTYLIRIAFPLISLTFRLCLHLVWKMHFNGAEEDTRGKRTSFSAIRRFETAELHLSSYYSYVRLLSLIWRWNPALENCVFNTVKASRTGILSEDCAMHDSSVRPQTWIESWLHLQEVNSKETLLILKSLKSLQSISCLLSWGKDVNHS